MNSSANTSADSRSIRWASSVGLVFMAIVLACFAAAEVRGSRAAASERHWPTVTASVNSVEARKGCDKGTGYNVRISYSYLSSGGVPEAGATERPIDGCVDEGTALSIARDHPVGSALQVKVSPADPQASVDTLELANDGSTLAAVLSGVGAIALIGIAIASRKRAGPALDRTDG